MSDKNYYDSKLATLTTIPAEAHKQPAIPMEHFLQEGSDLYQIAVEDKEELLARGINWTFVDDLPARIGAARFAESNWRQRRYSKDEIQLLWNEKSAEAFELRDELLEEFRFAFRKNEELHNTLSAIADGHSNADMIQDLADLAALGREQTELLATINFDVTLLDKAQQSAEQLAPLLSATTADSYSANEFKTIRDAAYTHLKEAMDEIREFGQFIFRRSDRKRAYASGYIRRRNQRHRRENGETIAE